MPLARPVLLDQEVERWQDEAEEGEDDFHGTLVPRKGCVERTARPSPCAVRELVCVF